MKFTKSHLIIYTLLGIIAMILGFMIGMYLDYQSRLAYWKQFGRGCSMVSEKQDKLIRSMLE